MPTDGLQRVLDTIIEKDQIYSTDYLQANPNLSKLLVEMVMALKVKNPAEQPLTSKFRYKEVRDQKLSDKIDLYDSWLHKKGLSDREEIEPESPAPGSPRRKKM